MRKGKLNRFCCYCGTTLNKFTFSREHVLPKSRNGSNKKSNKLPCCKSCNSEKSNMTIDEYIEWLEDKQPDNWSFKVLMCQRIVANHI